MTQPLDAEQCLALVTDVIRTAEAKRPSEDADAAALDRWERVRAAAATEITGILRSDGRL